MKAALIQHYKQKQLDLADVAIPTINDDDVLVEIYAASINPIDYKVRDGQLKLLLSYKMPLILGNDFAGVIVEVGKNVTKFKRGDEVYGRPRKSRIGTFAEYLSIHEDDIALKPKNLTFEQAAAVPLVGLTTYQAFHDIMHLKPQDRILIQAGAGGVGTFAIQLAKAMGAYVATTTSSKNIAFVKSLGADRIIDYHHENFDDALTDYNYVYDTLGGDHLTRAFSIVKPGGKIVSVSGLPNGRFAKAYGMPFWKKALFTFATRNITALEKKTGVDYHFLFMKPSGTQLDHLRTLLESGNITPVLDRVVPFAQIQQAFEYSEAGRAKGKIVIQIKQP